MFTFAPLTPSRASRRGHHMVPAVLVLFLWRAQSKPNKSGSLRSVLVWQQTDELLALGCVSSIVCKQVASVNKALLPTEVCWLSDQEHSWDWVVSSVGCVCVSLLLVLERTADRLGYLAFSQKWRKWAVTSRKTTDKCLLPKIKFLLSSEIKIWEICVCPCERDGAWHPWLAEKAVTILYFPVPVCGRL